MSRFFRNAAILAKIEATYGVDAVPTGVANALLVSNMNIDQLNASNVDRALVRPFFGGSEQLQGAANVSVSFDVELAGSGTAATPAAWSPLAQACGMTEIIGASWVELAPNTLGSATKSLTIYYHLDGVLHKLLGARGSFSCNMGVGERPTMSFKFIGLDGGISAVANPSATLTAWKTPLVVSDPNTSDVTVGGTYATGAVTGGTVYPSRGLTFDLGADAKHLPMLGGESVNITGRMAKGKVALDLTAAQHVTFMADVKANTLRTCSLEHGTVAGNKVLIYAPAVQFTNPTYEDVDGIALNSFDLVYTPTSAGNDEIRIFTK
jgi:hypothetical protein